MIYEKEYLENVADSNCWNRNGHIRFIWSNFESGRKISDLMLENIEALANGESGEKTAPACKGEAYIYGPMKRVKDSHSKCVMQNITKVEEDGICWY